MSDNIIGLTFVCDKCNKQLNIPVFYNDYEKFVTNKCDIDKSFPYISSEQREQMANLINCNCCTQCLEDKS